MKLQQALSETVAWDKVIPGPPTAEAGRVQQKQTTLSKSDPGGGESESSGALPFIKAPPNACFSPSLVVFQLPSSRGHQG